jgi:hypothetical protein
MITVCDFGIGIVMIPIISSGSRTATDNEY